MNFRQHPIISFRSLFIGILLVLLNCYLMMVAELRWYVVLSLNPLFVTPIFFIFLLIIANAILRKLFPHLVLRANELLIIYLMLALSCTLATHDYLINLLGIIGYPAWAATPSNQWQNKLFPYLPQHLFVWNKEILAGLFQGGSQFSLREHLPAFIKPLLYWFAFILVSIWMMFCLNTLIRRSWLEQTKLSFPIVQLPLAMISEEAFPKFFRSRYMWAGFCAAFYYVYGTVYRSSILSFRGYARVPASFIFLIIRGTLWAGSRFRFILLLSGWASLCH